MEDFEKKFKIGDYIEATLRDGALINGKIYLMSTIGDNTVAAPKLSEFSIKCTNSQNESIRNIKFSDVLTCRKL